MKWESSQANLLANKVTILALSMSQHFKKKKCLNHYFEMNNYLWKMKMHPLVQMLLLSIVTTIVFTRGK